ncbi:MAG: hypothetical protein QM601_09815, partial [Pseudoxanthomonas sp.]
MRFRKTPLAQEVLATHRAPLSLRERRALILSDGRRSQAQLAAMLGEDTPALLQRLCQAGYLWAEEATGPAPAKAEAAPGPAASAAPVATVE